jgi:hypothetical protein
VPRVSSRTLGKAACVVSLSSGSRHKILLTAHAAIPVVLAAGLVACCPLHIEISHVNNARRARNLDLADGMSITPTTSLPERDLCGSIGMLSPRLGQKNAFAPAKYSNQHEKEAPTFSQPHLLQICNTGPCLPAIEQLKGRTGACIIIPHDLVMSYCHHQLLP